MVTLEPKDINYRFWVYDEKGDRKEARPILVSDTHKYKRVRLDLSDASRLEVRAEEKGFTPKRFVIELSGTRSIQVDVDATPTFDVVFVDKYISDITFNGRDVGDVNFLGTTVMLRMNVDMGGRVIFSGDLRMSQLNLRRTSLLKFQGAIESSTIVADVANLEFDPTGEAFYAVFSQFKVKTFKLAVKAREVGEGLRFFGGAVDFGVANMELPPLIAFWAVDGGLDIRDYYPIAPALELIYWENFRIPEGVLRVPGVRVRRKVYPYEMVKWAGIEWGEYHPMSEQLVDVGPAPMVYRGKLYIALEGGHITAIPLGYAYSFAVGQYPLDAGLLRRLLLAYERTPATHEGEPVLTVSSDREHMLSLIKKKNDVPLITGSVVLPASNFAIMSLYSEGHLFKIVIPEDQFVSLLRMWISKLEEEDEQL
jgi:hypothetical protein